MAKRISVYVGDELADRLDILTGKVNVSKICVDALLEVVEAHEKAAEAGQVVQGQMAVVRYAQQSPLIALNELQETDTIKIPADIEQTLKTMRTFEARGFRNGWAIGIETIKNLMAAGIGVAGQK